MWHVVHSAAAKSSFPWFAASLAVVLPSVPPAKETKLGLDLQGGVQLVYEARPTKQQPTVTDAYVPSGARSTPPAPACGTPAR